MEETKIPTVAELNTEDENVVQSNGKIEAMILVLIACTTEQMIAKHF